MEETVFWEVKSRLKHSRVKGLEQAQKATDIKNCGSSSNTPYSLYEVKLKLNFPWKSLLWMAKGARIDQQLVLYFPNTPERRAWEDPILCVLNKQPCE